MQGQVLDGPKQYHGRALKGRGILTMHALLCAAKSQHKSDMSFEEMLGALSFCCLFTSDGPAKVLATGTMPPHNILEAFSGL